MTSKVSLYFRRGGSIMRTYAKSIQRKILAAAVAVTLGICLAPAAPAAAFGLGDLGTVIAAGQVYAQQEKALNYFENEGRFKYMEQVKKTYGVNNDYTANAMLDNIMGRLSTSIAAVDPSIKNNPYNYFVNNEKSFNAFCTLGHNLSVNIGAFDTLDYNEPELAVVIAHELGHGQKNHPIAGARKSMTVALAGAVLTGGASGIAQAGTALALNIGKAKLITKPMEDQADELAFTYYTGAGYNIGAGAAVWERVIEKSKGSSNASSFVGDMFNDHPTNVARLNNYNNKITEWSGDKVKVDSKTGAITVNGKAFFTPAASGNLSGKERAYFAAGNLAAVYHNHHNGEPVTVSGTTVYVGPQDIVDAGDYTSAANLQARLQSIL